MMQRIIWTEKRPDEEILNVIGENRQLLKFRGKEGYLGLVAISDMSVCC